MPEEQSGSRTHEKFLLKLYSDLTGASELCARSVLNYLYGPEPEAARSANTCLAGELPNWAIPGCVGWNQVRHSPHAPSEAD